MQPSRHRGKEMTQNDATATVEATAPPQEGAYLPCPLVLNFCAIEMTDEQFVKFCADNGELRIELTARRELIVMPPAFPATGMRNNALSSQVYNWSKQDGTGISFDSSAGFTFPQWGDAVAGCLVDSARTMGRPR